VAAQVPVALDVLRMIPDVIMREIDAVTKSYFMNVSWITASQMIEAL
jgi:hypothetical protein